jgi:response regulator RpfG family c-di-GMP phosphodiesterase
VITYYLNRFQKLTVIRITATQNSRQEPLPKATILLVDDSEIDRTIMRTLLTKENYHVIEAYDGKMALEYAKAESHRIDLLLTDIQMPGMSGVALAKMIFEFSPKTKVLFISGFRNRLPMELDGQRIEFIEKTTHFSDLCKKVEEVLKKNHPIIDFFSKTIALKD